MSSAGGGNAAVTLISHFLSPGIDIFLYPGGASNKRVGEGFLAARVRVARKSLSQSKALAHLWKVAYFPSVNFSPAVLHSSTIAAAFSIQSETTASAFFWAPMPASEGI